ncbi:hypothetical protein Despr_0266 [Desulfobulbus propionicus DSM 2032]|uniref:Mor transcription activator domain-containing protein n=1 Tax=Desulfobulbus propionicus (strain ATCC 33891 / DSM 2032 / VKM B-1956 / 1pr3) TaxID=577650 RepID=A0A7U4DMY3_DESPD|nr:hypothetical protein [Desulfobulbus propionicus]ADW16451.1 hypothetical protein Despr_0266 [Desulfobulbus propionicus DSM 2032]
MDNRDVLRCLRPPVVHLPKDFLPKISDLPGELKTVATAIDEHMPGDGVRLTLLLAQVFPGQHLYLRKPDKFIRLWRNVIMRSIYDQGNITAHELSSLTGVCERQVWTILGEAADEQQGKQGGAEEQDG